MGAACSGRRGRASMGAIGGRGWAHTFGCGAAVVAMIALAGGGCGQPKFPSCDNDEHCKADGHDGQKRVCVNHVCVDCRADDACAAGKTCQAGTCTPVPGYCDETAKCPSGED